MKVGAAAVLCAIFMVALPAATKACDVPDALGTSRVLKLNANTTVGFGKSFPPLPLSRGEYVLAFDDGPAPGSTPQILDILARECIRAAFFMIGKRAEANPEIVARERDAGHTLGSHSYSHRRLDTLHFEQAVGDIERGYQAVEAAAYGAGGTGRRARLFRFPEYKSTPELISFVHSRNGIVASWDISTEDWRGQAPQVTMERVRHLLDRRDRGVISLHDYQKNTVALLPMIIAELRNRGVRIVHLEAE